MVVVFAILRAGLRIEKVVASYQLKNLGDESISTLEIITPLDSTDHARHTPNICTRTPFGAQNDFRGTILPGLDVIGKVMTDPASVAQISNLDRDDVYRGGLGGRIVDFLLRILFQGDPRNFFR